MRKYELMLVVVPTFPQEDEKKRTELVEKLLNDQEITDLAINVWGKRQLAYEIKKQTEALYIVVTFQSNQVNAAKLEQKIKLQTEVIRYLLTRLED